MLNLVKVALCAAAVAGAGFAAPAAAQAPKPVALAVVDVKVVALGYRATQLIGREVSNEKGQEIGKIDDLIVGRDKVLFAIIGVGGFLGMGEHLIAIPYNRLGVTAKSIVLPGATTEAVRKLPQFRYAP
jgi:sporulation protein YlmC with PRC-barrel domain